MQVIRLSKNNQQRNILIKLYEMILALRLELRYSKEDILRLYVSHAPFGGNVVGLEAAAWRYYGRPAAQLSWGESASLAVLPNAPAIIFPGRNQAQFVKKRNRLLSKLYKKGVIDKITCELAQEEPVPGTPHPLPRLAPHYLQDLIHRGSQGQKIKSTLQKPLQEFAVQTAQQYIRIYAGNFIHNMAIVVMDTRSGDVLARVGNTELPGTDNAAFVDHATASRSSGSILKPFLYAAMLQEGSILPTSMVADIPTRYGSYRPENFEKTFMGAVPADVALARSLNIPAVRQLHEFGVEKFRNILLNCGFTTITKPADHYGLSLILGGAEVNLLETTAVYAGMGRLAQTSAAWWFTLEALTQVNRPSLEIGWEHFASTRKIAWKTGTSIGSRDAWSVGVTPDFTVGVWVGNATGEGRPGLTGVTHAAPVMFELFKRIGNNRWFERPTQDMEKMDVCKLSGFRAGLHCEKEERWVPANGRKVRQCPYHRSVMLDATGSWRVNSSCYPVSSMKEHPWFVLPPAIEYFYRQHHPGYQLLPPLKPDCETQTEIVMDILIPDNNTAVYVPSGSDGEPGMIIFEAVHRNPATTLFWHMDGEFLGSTRNIHKLELSPATGKHLLVVQDEAGNVVRRRFVVK
jgi:penicillin-binding protein 1C